MRRIMIKYRKYIFIKKIILKKRNILSYINITLEKEKLDIILIKLLMI